MWNDPIYYFALIILKTYNLTLILIYNIFYKNKNVDFLLSKIFEFTA